MNIKKGSTSSKGSTGGFTLVEMLVVIFISSVLAVLITQSLALSLRGSRKSESVATVRENVEYAMKVMERSIRNAKGLDCASSSGAQIIYEDEYGEIAFFECVTLASDTYIASNSALPQARLTSSDTRVTNCPAVFSCDSSSIPHSVGISINAETVRELVEEGAEVTSSTRILLRNY